MKIDEALESYLRQLEANGRSKHTIDQARRHVVLLATWLASTGHTGAIDDVHHEDLARFGASPVMRLRADGGPRKPTSANALRSSLRAFFAYAHAAGYASTNAARLVRRARCGRSYRPGVPEGDCANFLGTLAAGTGPLARRDFVMFTLMLRTGIRVGSTIALDVGDVDLEGAKIVLRSMKNADQDIVFLPADVVSLLREYIGEHRRGALFLGAHGSRISCRQVGRRLKLWLDRAGISHRLSPHGLRHEFGTRLLRATGNLAVVQRAMHHRSIASTMTYARVDDDVVRRAIGS